MKGELLYVKSCPGAESLVPRLRALLAEVGLDPERALSLRRVDAAEEAARARFLGSPTVRVDGEDVEPGAGARTDYGLRCRLYRSDSGASVTPPEEWITAALGRTGV